MFNYIIIIYSTFNGIQWKIGLYSFQRVRSTVVSMDIQIYIHTYTRYTISPHMKHTGHRYYSYTVQYTHIWNTQVTGTITTQYNIPTYGTHRSQYYNYTHIWTNTHIHTHTHWSTHRWTLSSSGDSIEEENTGNISLLLWRRANLTAAGWSTGIQDLRWH